MPELPAGLTPVAAARLGFWLLGKRSHAAAERRTAFGTRASSGTLASEFCATVAPWRIEEYPAAGRLLAGILGIPETYAKNLLNRSWHRKLARKHARVLADWLSLQAVRYEALALQLRQHADRARSLPTKPDKLRYYGQADNNSQTRD